MPTISSASGSAIEQTLTTASPKRNLFFSDILLLYDCSDVYLRYFVVILSRIDKKVYWIKLPQIYCLIFLLIAFLKGWWFAESEDACTDATCCCKIFLPPIFITYRRTDNLHVMQRNIQLEHTIADEISFTTVILLYRLVEIVVIALT